MHESTAFDVWEEEAERRGELRGKIRSTQRVLLIVGRKLFGSPNPETESALAAIQDFDRLERMTDVVLTVSSWQELLATP